ILVTYRSRERQLAQVNRNALVRTVDLIFSTEFIVLRRKQAGTDKAIDGHADGLLGVGQPEKRANWRHQRIFKGCTHAFADDVLPCYPRDDQRHAKEGEQAAVCVEQKNNARPNGCYHYACIDQPDIALAILLELGERRLDGVFIEGAETFSR